MRLIWLASELRAAGLRVVEVDGWKTRGSEAFDPEGVTWHATAGSRTATAAGEVGVLLHGSTSAPPPIAQLMIWRDGTVYVVAAGRCNHNKVGWSGVNKGLGNTRLLGIEMANDNRGEPWPPVQLDAARRATAAILRKLGVDPMRRLAGHYEHQPAAGRPAGETSTKTDPAGVVMRDERRRVAALMKGDDMPSIEEIRDAVRTELTAFGKRDPLATIYNRTGYVANTFAPAIAKAVAAIVPQDVDEDALAAALAAKLPADRDDVTADELQAAIVGAARELLGQSPPAGQ